MVPNKDIHLLLRHTRDAQIRTLTPYSEHTWQQWLARAATSLADWWLIVTYKVTWGFLCFDSLLGSISILLWYPQIIKESCRGVTRAIIGIGCWYSSFLALFRSSFLQPGIWGSDLSLQDDFTLLKLGVNNLLHANITCLNKCGKSRQIQLHVPATCSG